MAMAMASVEKSALLKLGFFPGLAARSPSPATTSKRRWRSGSFFRQQQMHVQAKVGAGLDLRQWVQQQGGFVWDGVGVVQSSREGVGLVAAKPLAAGTTIIALPHHLPLSFPPLQQPHSLSTSDALLLGLAQKVPVRLGLKLLAERAKEGSFWWPYIRMLPQTFSIPIFFSGQQINELHYPPVVQQVKKRCRFLLQFSTEVNKATENVLGENHPFQEQQVDASSLGWAMAAVSSRAFRTYNLMGTDNAMMLPLIDLCNHSFQPTARILQDLTLAKTEKFIEVVTEEKLEVGTPISLNYGALSNDVLLMDYGFIVAQNLHDRVELKFDGLLLDAARFAAGLYQSNSVSFSSPAPWQLPILAKLNLVGSNASLQVMLGGPDHVDGRLLAALRVLYAEDPADLQNIDLITLQTWKVATPLGLDIERKVLKTLSALSAVVLNYFPTTIQDDKDVLVKEDSSSTKHLITLFCHEKKRLLVNVMAGLKSRVSSLGKIDNVPQMG
ncbi:hypothetical protein O6H91_03G005300 [Diphasiastrum complanatum]|uniref:Uncharacterized protein n=1 Tax=Diphasiastrum complanatum TaxID=34168 RepID=A0ACC2E3E8_DIPCM|nr:hypothetical protein O6H91_03G005300 [Diphasiastrum complanatum]